MERKFNPKTGGLTELPWPRSTRASRTAGLQLIPSASVWSVSQSYTQRNGACIKHPSRGTASGPELPFRLLSCPSMFTCPPTTARVTLAALPVRTISTGVTDIGNEPHPLHICCPLSVSHANCKTCRRPAKRAIKPNRRPLRLTAGLCTHPPTPILPSHADNPLPDPLPLSSFLLVPMLALTFPCIAAMALRSHRFGTTEKSCLARFASAYFRRWSRATSLLATRFPLHHHTLPVPQHDASF